MAETAVTLVFDRLEKLLLAEVRIFEGVHDEVKGIKDELELINSFLKDADKQAEAAETNNSSTSPSSSSLARQWVVKMRELAFRIEDVVDHYLLKVVERRQRHGAFGAVTKGVEKLKTATHRHDISHEIRKIKEEMDRLSKTRASLDFKQSTITVNANENQRPFDRRLGAHFAEESDLVGIKRDQKVMTQRLLGGESKLSVMVVVGPAGIGKTTIVKNVYTKQKEMQSFQCYAWITVSHLQDEFMLLKAIIENIHAERPNPNATVALKSNEEESLTSQIREHLKGKRYLIVLDDVQESRFWGVLKHAMVDNNKRSRVIITTRDGGVADFCRSVPNANVHVHKLKLSPRDALELFHRKTFGTEGCPEELKALAENFVRICNGVPRAIVAIAGLLSTKRKTEPEWRKVHSQLGSLLQSDHFRVVQQAMSENYHALPSHLKRCLLYFGLFPEGYSISCMRLARLWVAEGFVKEKEGENTQIILEEQAEEYLIELFRRGLVQFSRVDFDGRRPKSCHVDHLMHKFIVKKCEEQSFSQVMMNDKITPSTSKLDSVGRRLTIPVESNDKSVALRSAAELKRVRSCFVFDEAKKWPLTKPFFSSFELLAGLDLCDARLDILPEEIGELLNLRYLSLRNTNIRYLPKSIGKLENLQTLDLKQTKVHELPKEITNLIKLRHLLAYYINSQHFGLDSLQGVKMKAELQNLTSLLKLSFLDASNSSNIIEELAELRKLRKLGIIKLRKQDGEALCKAIQRMTHLCCLSIGATDSNEILMLQYLVNPPQSLQRLHLYGRLEKFPNWVPKLKNLTRLYLKWSSLEEDPLLYLSNLSELLHLELYEAYGGDELHFKNAWLRSLKVLHIESMPKLRTIKVDRGALPCLEKLKIGKCQEMVQVPRDLQNLTSLNALHLYDMPAKFINRMKGPQGEDYGTVSKIPLVLCTSEDYFATLHNLDALNDEFSGWIMLV